MTMREKMAKVMLERFKDERMSWGEFSGDDALKLADAALDALMEPTPEMVDAVRANIDDDLDEERVVMAIEAVIKAAKAS